MNQSKHIASTFKHALIYGASGMLGKAIGFIMLPVYAHYLRGEGYGMVGMIDVVLSVVTLLIGYGVQGAMSRFYYEKTGDEERKQLISTAIILMFALVVVVSFPVLVFSDQIAWLAFGKEGLGYYIILAILTFIASMTSKSAETYILVRQKSFFYSGLSLSRLCLALLLNIYFIVYLQLGVLGYLYSGLAVAVIFSVILHGYALFNVGVCFVKNDAVAILRFSLPLLPGYVAMFIRNNTDRVLLRSFLGLTQLGAFEMLFKFATLIGMLVVGPFSKIWGIKRFEIADSEGGPALMARMFTLMLSLMFFVGLVLGVEIPVILKLLTPEEFWLSGAVVGLAVLSRIILASYYHFFFGLLHAKKTHKISIIQAVTTAVNFVLALLLIKPFGILGAVVVSCLSNTFQCVMAYKLATPYYKIPFEWRRIVAISLFSFFLFMIIDSVAISQLPVVSGWLGDHVAQPVEWIMGVLCLDNIRDGEIVTYALANIPLLAEGLLKLFLSFLFIVALIIGGILPGRKILAFVKQRSLKPILG